MALVIKIVLGIAAYTAYFALTCMFLKGATQLGNAYEEKKEAEELIRKLEARGGE